MTDKHAIPISYGTSGIGSVNVVAEKGPPLSVHQWTEADGEDNKHIAIEFEDITKTVEKQNSFNGLDDSEVMRLCMHLADARKLTHNLISRLAESGDRVAKRIQENMNDSMEVVRALDNAPVALCDLYLTSPCSASFDLCWPIGNKKPNKLNMENTDWIVEKDGYSTAWPPIRKKEQVYAMLRIIRKYAEALGVLLKIKDRNNILNDIDYIAFLHPYNVPPINPTNKLTLVDCRVHKTIYQTIVFKMHRPYSHLIKCESDMRKTLFEIASMAYEQKLLIKFIDPEKLLAKHNVANIFGKNLYIEEWP